MKVIVTADFIAYLTDEAVRAFMAQYPDIERQCSDPDIVNSTVDRLVPVVIRNPAHKDQFDLAVIVRYAKKEPEGEWSYYYCEDFLKANLSVLLQTIKNAHGVTWQQLGQIVKIQMDLFKTPLYANVDVIPYETVYLGLIFGTKQTPNAN
jgi:hypothetical protein